MSHYQDNHLHFHQFSTTFLHKITSKESKGDTLIWAVEQPSHCPSQGRTGQCQPIWHRQCPGCDTNTQSSSHFQPTGWTNMTAWHTTGHYSRRIPPARIQLLSQALRSATSIYRLHSHISIFHQKQRNEIA